eukprot:Sspe_Gene.27418::Locus_11799_Transcript_1_1_Confidence_1.000_Length_1387::g.27418::m.27418
MSSDLESMWEELAVRDMPQGSREWKNIQTIVRRSFGEIMKVVQRQARDLQQLQSEAQEYRKQLVTVELLCSRVDELERKVTAQSSKNEIKMLSRRVPQLDRAIEETSNRVTALEGGLKKASSTVAAEMKEVARCLDEVRDLRQELEHYPTLSRLHEHCDRKADRSELESVAERQITISSSLKDIPTREEVHRVVNKALGKLSMGPAVMTGYSPALHYPVARHDASEKREALQPCARWSFRGGTVPSHRPRGAIPWTTPTVAQSQWCGCFIWEPTASGDVAVTAPGVYEIAVGVFCNTSKPVLSVRIDGDTVMSSISCKTYVVKRRKAECAAARCQQFCLTGQTFSDYLWLPGGARITVHLDGDETKVVEAFLQLKALR